MSNIVQLKHKGWILDIAPECGGSIAGCSYQMHNIFRPATKEALENRNQLGMASFPLVPYSNRIAHSCFTFEDTEVVLQPNLADHPHVLHGQGWNRPWDVVEQGHNYCVLEFTNRSGDEWPWPYKAQQRFELDDTCLTVTMTIENLSDKTMPTGLGMHPYFARSPGCTLTTGLDKMWTIDRERAPDVLPVELIYMPADVDFSAGRDIDDVQLDHCFVGWNRSAIIEWADKPFKINMTGDGTQDFMVIFTPKGEDFFCVEAVTNMTDAFRRIDDMETGLVRLPAGKTFKSSTYFNIESE